MGEQNRETGVDRGPKTVGKVPGDSLNDGGTGGPGGGGDELLGHLARRRIHERVARTPGVHYTALKEDLHMGDGVLNHHVRVLEKEGFIISRSVRHRKCFYPTDRRYETRPLDHLTDLQAGILFHVGMEQGINQGELAVRLGVSKQALNYHLRELCADKLVYRRKTGRYTQFFANPVALADLLL
jgi:predicted transcriptional regulator